MSHTLLTLPPELREQIFRELLSPSANSTTDPSTGRTTYAFSASLVVLRLNRQLRIEARKVFHILNPTVRICTPWAQAASYVGNDGMVPVLATGKLAERTISSVMTVNIIARPGLTYNGVGPANYDMDMYWFLLHAHDLPAFTESWYLSALSNPGMNEWMALDLELDDEYGRYKDVGMPRALQRTLVEPFGRVKGLAGFRLHAALDDIEVDEEVMEHTKKLQSEPDPSVTECLKETMRLKNEGNAALKREQYDEAMRLYEEAWKAMHIFVKGRTRHVHADAFYFQEILEAPFAGKRADAERLSLRIALVANTTLLYIRMKNYDMARFWGLRTIRVMREAMGIPANMPMNQVEPEGEAATSFQNADLIGKIYYRTGLACTELGDMETAVHCLRVAHIYLPRDDTIRRALQAAMPRIG